MRALVTGAARGLGASLVHELAGRGIDVIGTIRGDAPSAISDRCEHLVQLDLGDRSSIEAAVAELIALETPIDILVNNAGLNGSSVGGGVDDCGPLEIDPDVFLREMEVNTVGPLLFTRGLLGVLAQTEHPRVINVSSQLGHNEVALRIGRDAGYNASKAALTTLTASFARVVPDVTFIAVHPGWVRTDMGGSAAALSADDSARMLVDMLLSVTPEQSGAFLDVDGSPFTP
ncbi:MAG: SDR family NAD(P)-dependent oxidoreductase [Actinomycetota bacterium]